MSKTDVRLDLVDDRANITIFTEQGVNVFTRDVLHKLGAIIRKVAQSPAVRTTVVQAEGKVFVAGADIREMLPFNPDDAHAYGRLGQDVYNDLAALPSITIAAINGAAMGGGLELALACDFRVVVKSAKLGMPETSLGLIPGWGGMTRLAKLVGMPRAKRMCLTAQPVSGEDAMSFGLVDEIVNSPEDLIARVAALCKSFRRAAPSAVALVKRALRDGNDLSAFADCFGHRESREGMKAFLEKRTASWME